MGKMSALTVSARKRVEGHHTEGERAESQGGEAELTEYMGEGELAEGLLDHTGTVGEMSEIEEVMERAWQEEDSNGELFI